MIFPLMCFFDPPTMILMITGFQGEILQIRRASCLWKKLDVIPLSWTLWSAEVRPMMGKGSWFPRCSSRPRKVVKATFHLARIKIQEKREETYGPVVCKWPLHLLLLSSPQLPLLLWLLDLDHMCRDSDPFLCLTHTLWPLVTYFPCRFPIQQPSACMQSILSLCWCSLH